MTKGTIQNKKYSSYKNSYVDWLGEIPSDWNLLPAMRFIDESKEKNIGMIEDQVLSLSYGNIITKTEEQLTGLVPESFETYQIVESGDIIIRGTDLQNDKKSLRTGLSKNRGIITSAYLNLRPKKGVSPRFLHYFFHSMDTTKSLYKYGSGLRQNLSFEDFKRMPIPDLTESHQNAIANFLDDKTEKIERAIAIKEQQIELLKERKQILIQNAVTRGLNPDAPMKESGIDWIGKIPEHWETNKFRFAFKFSKGLTITKEDLIDGGIPCVNYGEIHSKFGFEVDPEKHSLKGVSAEFLNKSTKSLLNRGNFIFADTSEDLDGSGNFTYLNSDERVFAGYHTIIARSQIDVMHRYLAYLFESQAHRNQIRRAVKGVKVYSITNTILKNILLLLPPKIEQEQIIEELDMKVDAIHIAVKTQTQQIQKLKEYKASLINSAVTGKIKVPA